METPAAADFALAPGGPVDKLLARLRMSDIEGRHVLKRAILTPLFAWVPLCVAAFVIPNAQADISFFHDIATHVRLLLMMPLLILAEASIGARSRMVVTQFLASGLIGDVDANRFEAAVMRARRLRDSTLAELGIAIAVGFGALSGVKALLAEPVTFWFERVSADGSGLSLAGWWYAAVASPIVMFLLLRWAWRYLVWWLFLARVSRLDLRLAASHPDRMGGLGFVAFNQSVFASVTFAVSCTVAAAAANRILNSGVELRTFQAPVIGFAVAAVVLGVAPMFVFTVRMVMAKRRAWFRYGRFASDYILLFEQRWLGKTPDDSVLGSGDIQSLADLGGGFERMSGMRPSPIDRRLLLSFLVAAVAPMLPLLLTVMPFKEIIRLLLKTVV